jgi:hypothetical protein
MDRSIRKLPDPEAQPSHGQRRRSVRHKLHTPAYASFSASQPGTVADLSELLNLNEEGFALQTSEHLQTNRAVTLCLELPETGGYIQGRGQVVWSDDTGRGGIRFAALTDTSRKMLKEWLFANLLIACSNHAARTGPPTHGRDNRPEIESKKSAPMETDRSGAGVSQAAKELPIAANPGSTPLSDIDDDVDAALRLATRRALTLTGSSGAALAFLTGVRTGEPAPPLGAKLDTGKGISGECVRSGRLVKCEDTESDPLVDPAVCRALGIGALMAAPIVLDFRVAGVIEVLSPHPRVFTASQEKALMQLVEIVAKIHRPAVTPDIPSQPTVWLDRPPFLRTPSSPGAAGHSSSDAADAPLDEIGRSIDSTLTPARNEGARKDSEGQVLQVDLRQEQEAALNSSPRLLYRSLLGLALAVAVIAVGYVFGPAAKQWTESRRSARQSLVPTVNAGNDRTSASSAPTAANSQKPVPEAELRRLADAGDADAQWQMGVRYHDGEGVPRDDAEAVQWFERAAERGNVAAQGALGAYYWRGRGVPADLSKAYFWSRIAMAQGDEMSKSRIEGLSSQMTREQVSLARQQAEMWIRTHELRVQSGSN